MVILHVLHRRTVFGRRLDAIGNGEDNAVQIGIPVPRTVFLSFVASGFLAGVGGLIGLLQVGAISAYLGKGMEFTAVAAIVVSTSTPTKSWDRNALLQPESRAAYQRLLAQGWTDAIRALHPKEPMYTFWDYMRKRWERDGGLRLDHILLSSALTERLQSAGVDRQTRGMEDASDHAPVWVRLRDGPDRRRAPLREASSQRRLRQGRRRRRKRSDRPIGPAMGQDGKGVQRELVSPHSRVARCW